MPRETLYLAFYYRPANTSGVQRAARLVKYLPEHGHRVHVVTSSVAGVSAEANVAYVPNGHTGSVLAAQTQLARALQRIAPYNEQLPWVPHAVEAGARLIEEHGITTILSTSPPVGTHFAAYWLKKRFPKLRWIADFRDPLFGSPTRTRRWATGYDRAVQAAFFRAADAVVTVTEPIAQRWRSLYPAMTPKIHVICNGFDPEEAFGPQPLPENGYKVLAHLGVIYPKRHPVAVVESLARLTACGRLDPRAIRLRLTGTLEDSDRFSGYPAVQALLKNGCLELNRETIPRAEAMRQVATSDALLLLDFADAQGGYAVPAKLYDYVLTGRPVLAVTPRNSPVHDILRRSGAPHFAIHEDDTADQVDEKVLGVFQTSSDPVIPSAWFFERFDGRAQAGTFAKLLTGETD